jgi:hypothetical protein
MLRPRLLLATLALTAVLPASARAATLSQPLNRCYVSVGPESEQRQIARVRAAGFTPNAPVDVLVDGGPADVTGDGVPDPVSADPSGRVIVDVRAPYQTAGQRPFGISVAEHANPANRVSAVSSVTALTVDLRPAQAAPSRRVHFVGRGFTSRAPVWAHYVFRGKLRRTVRLVRRPKGSCGTFSVRRRQIPVVRPRTGRWTLQVDQQKAFSPTPESVFVRLDITVAKVIRAR